MSSVQPGLLGSVTRPQVGRRDFLARLLGHLALAAGGTLVGAALAYEVYRKKAVDDLSDLRQGALLRPATVTQNPASAAAPTSAPQDVPATARPDVAAAPIATPVASVPGDEPPIFVATAPAEESPDLTPDLVPVRLRIDAIGLPDAKIVELGTHLDKGQLVWETADHAVGFLKGTGVPGRAGNLVLGGHISSPVRGEGNIFRNLPNLKNKIGSTVSVLTAGGTWFHYQVIGTDVVTPNDTWVLDPTPEPSVTLLTCVPDGVYTFRFIARGKLIGSST